jgi:hypothetical protein
MSLTEGQSGKARKGCLITLGVIVIILLIISIFLFNLPQRLGIIASPGERMVSQTPDRIAATALKAELTRAGFNTQGIDLYVMPLRNSDGSILLASLDSSKGFNFSNISGQDAITDYLKRLADLDKSGTYHIEQVVIDYKGDDGESMVSATAPVNAIRKFSQGTMSRQDFMQAIEGKVNISKLVEVGLP